MITCFGSSSIDLFVRANRLPLLGETVIGNSFFKAFGGKGANQIVQAALLGSPTVFVGRVGLSSDGRDIADNLQRVGVDISFVNTQDDVASGVALIEVEEGGANRIVVVPGANGLSVGSDVVPALKNASFLLLQLEIPFDAVTFALQEAGKLKTVHTVLNPSPVPTTSEAKQALLQHFSFISFLILNEHETEALCNIVVSDVASAFLACKALIGLGCSCVVLTLGGIFFLYLFIYFFFFFSLPRSRSCRFSQTWFSISCSCSYCQGC